MSHRIQYVVCGSELRVADSSEAWITCPRCLTAAMNPRCSGVTATMPPTSAAACPECGADVPPSWRYCPYCNVPISRPRQLPRPLSVDADVRQDRKRAGASPIALGVLLVVGIIAFLASGGACLVGASQEGPTVLIFGLIVIGLITTGLVTILFRSRNKTTKAVSSAVSGAAIGVTGPLLVGLLVLFAICARINNFGFGHRRSGGWRFMSSGPKDDQGHIDFLSIDALQDLEPGHTRAVRALIGLAEVELEEMEAVLTRSRALPPVLAKLDGLLAPEEIRNYKPLHAKKTRER